MAATLLQHDMPQIHVCNVERYPTIITQYLDNLTIIIFIVKKIEFASRKIVRDYLSVKNV